MLKNVSRLDTSHRNLLKLHQKPNQPNHRQNGNWKTPNIPNHLYKHMRFHRRSLNFNLISSYLQSLIRLESFYFTTRNSQHFRLFRPSNRSLHQRNPLIKTRKSRLTKNSSSPHFNSRNCFYFHGRNLRLVSLKNSSRFWNGPVCISFNRFS